MATIYPAATYRQIRTARPMSRHDVVCLHTMVGTLAGTENHFRRVELESHFGVDADGAVVQWQDVELVARANGEGNHRLISVETVDKGPGFPSWTGADVPAWNDAQVEAIARLLAWLCDRYAIPCAPIPDSLPARRGIGYHRQGVRGSFPDGLRPGGELWSSATGKVCPGDRRIAQVPAIIARANVLLSPMSGEATTMRYVNLTNDDGTTPTRSAVLTVDPVGRSIVLPPGARAWVQWSAFLPDGGVARVDWLVATFPGRTQPFDPFELRHRGTGAIELEAGTNGVGDPGVGHPEGRGDRLPPRRHQPRLMFRLDADFIRGVAPRFTGAKRRRQLAIIEAVAPAFGPTLDRYEIDTRLRIAHFMGQVTHECDGFATTEEYASGEAYEGRLDLGNTRAGDGRRYKGRGLVQLTGRANYQRFGRLLGLPLEAEPTLAAEPVTSLVIACEYWRDRAINGPADRDDLDTVTRRVNGGTRGLTSRRTFYLRAVALLDAMPGPDGGGFLRLPMRHVTLANDDGSTPVRSAMLTIDPVGRSIVLPPNARAWLQWSAFLPDGGTAYVDWLVVTFPARVQPVDPVDLHHRDTGALELPPGATGVELRVTAIPRGAAVAFHLDAVNHA